MREALGASFLTCLDPYTTIPYPLFLSSSLPLTQPNNFPWPTSTSRCLIRPPPAADPSPSSTSRWLLRPPQPRAVFYTGVRKTFASNRDRSKPSLDDFISWTTMGTRRLVVGVMPAYENAPTRPRGPLTTATKRGRVAAAQVGRGEQKKTKIGKAKTGEVKTREGHEGQS